jgi:hypothetical protein
MDHSSQAERPTDDRLFSDPLSKHFAGEEAMRQARERANASRFVSLVVSCVYREVV